ncbi:endonuclease domain-containing protein [Luteimonas viscosa]|uniref:Endonuclease domain-containing protein n=1 Tax=Luteimonas viscosa TaxID=1132694 RepID=A0A5D4XJ57_9GAMM|nr:endonuclease domain-containing protein [Luteimonas viscosa]TYT23032.1 endonuclease domain-containing protein [Luteimonas viscosa]
MRTTTTRADARRLRQAMTDAELRLWFHLRNRACSGWKFRRQRPVGPFFVDFICVEAGLVVEADGSQHLASLSDRRRTRFLESRGLEVLRFWNDDVLLRTDVVLEVIHAAPARRGVARHG